MKKLQKLLTDVEGRPCRRIRYAFITGTAVLFVLLAVLFVGPAGASTAESDPETATAESGDEGDFPSRSSARLWGHGRIGTSVMVSREANDDGEPRDVFLARADNYPDALVGGSANGPKLLIPHCHVPQIVKEEIQRLEPEQVIALGGSSAICDEALQDAADAAGHEHGFRLAGANRFETAAEIARYAADNPERVYVATGEDFADALAAGALTDGPVLLAPSDGDLPPSIASYFAEETPNEVVALGGTAAISDSILDAAADAAGTDTTSRLAGTDRIETAIAISNYVFEDSERTYLARADDFPDALAASVLTQDGPILLTHTDSLPGSVFTEIDRLDPFEVVALGGESAITDGVLRAAARQ